MSFILDALRKSEHERQRQTGPGIADIRGAAVARSGLPPWALILGALLLVNVLVVVALAFRGNSSDKGGAVVSAPPVESAPATSAAPAATTSRVATVPSSPTRAPTVAPTQVQPPPPSTPVVRTPAPERATEPAPAEEPMLRPSVKPEPAPPRELSAESYASLPTYGEVTLQGASLPELHIDLHVYAAKPADRLVFINTRKYREGGQMPDGTTIERIIPDGVVLNHHGVRFLLPRQ